MTTWRLMPPMIALALLVSLAVAAGAQGPAIASNGGCTPGADYDPACDVDHDGDVDVIDVQLAAGHWNQAGTWMSDNDHDHLGQTWEGYRNPLVISGTFNGWLDAYAPLVLNNSDGNGVEVSSVGNDGVVVRSAGNHGVVVQGTGDDAVYVHWAGYDGVYLYWTAHDGVYVNTASHDGVVVNSAEYIGLRVNWANHNGLDVYSAGDNGAYVRSAGSPSSYNFQPADSHNGFVIAGAEDFGLFVGRADEDGVRVYSAGADGVDVAGTSLAGYFRGNIQVTGSCSGCRLATFALNNGESTLAPGDLVSLTGLRESGVDSVPMLVEVEAADDGDTVVGVVQGWAELVTEEEPRPGEIGLRLVPREGAAEPGQYVTIAYSGLTQVKASGPIAQGSRLAVGPVGAARAMRTVTVDGIELAENAAVIGTALESLEGDGLVWVLVNLQ